VSQYSEFYRHGPLCFLSTSNTKNKRNLIIDSVRKPLDTPSYVWRMALYISVSSFVGYFSHWCDLMAVKRHHMKV